MGARSRRCRYIAPLLIALVAGGCGAPRIAPTTQEPSAAEHVILRVNRAADDSVTTVDVLGLPADELQAFSALAAADRAKLLRVFVAAAESEDLPTVLGTVSVVADAVRFTPRYLFGRGLDYRLKLQLPAPAGAAPIEHITLDFHVARPATPPTQLTHIYPSTDRLPENQLKFYLHFSAAMSRGDAYRHVHLLDAEGREMPAVFLELGEELWSPDLRRFTLLLDPGRVKRGLVPRAELGPVLEADRDYTLVIDADWPDANSQNLAAGARKPFHTLPADEQPLDQATWKVTAPPAETTDPLVVRFPEPLDHSLLTRVLRVTNAEGQTLTGLIDTSDAETCWRFTPTHAWVPGEYHLMADTTLEDLAGNAIGRAFDVDTFERIGERIETATISLPFVVSPAR